MTSKQDAMDAVGVLLRYIEGDDSREGLIETPKRVIESFSEIYAGYDMKASEVLSSTFNGEGYDGIVLLRDIEFHDKIKDSVNVNFADIPEIFHQNW